LLYHRIYKTNLIKSSDPLKKHSYIVSQWWS